MAGHKRLRKKMRDHKYFLADLYNQKSHLNKRRIENSSVQERKVLLNVLFCIAHGHIPIKRRTYNELLKSNRKPKLVEIGTSLKKLLKATCEAQVTCLKQFSKLYPVLLEPLFKK